MSTASVQAVSTSIGKTFTRQVTVTADGHVCKDPIIPAAKAGSLTTRTDNDTGTLTMTDSGHGIGTGNRLDVYWTNADGTQGRRIGMTVGTVSGTSVPIDGGSGDNLPLANVGVAAMVPQLETFATTTAALKALFVGCPVNASAVFRDSTPTVVATIKTTGALGAYSWEDTSGITNPLASQTTTADVYLSHADTLSSQQVSALALIN